MNSVDTFSLMHFDELPGSAIVRLPVVTAVFGISPATAWRWCKAGALPQPCRINSITGWRVGELRMKLETHRLQREVPVAACEQEQPETCGTTTSIKPKMRVSDRNLNVFDDVVAGETLSGAGRKYGISPGRARQIVCQVVDVLLERQQPVKEGAGVRQDSNDLDRFRRNADYWLERSRRLR